MECKARYAGTARVKNPFLRDPPQKLVGAVLCGKGVRETEVIGFLLFKF
ncbi:hypothetical protein [Lysinibacillus parviboronicapiens]|nr:hypothetical protein [Lysinibacillus parviboronicapiens]